MSSPKFSMGDQVVLVSSRDAKGAIIRDLGLKAQEYWYTVFFGARKGNYPESSLELYSEDPDPISLFKENHFGSRETLSKIVTYTKLRQPLHNNIYAYRASRTNFYEYQFKPLIKFLNSNNQRLLIADEVGLGKTIEAGLIYQEMNSRHRLDRILIACPSSLRFKWQDEMNRRFSEEFKILDAGGVREFLRTFESRGHHTQLKGICSLQTLRGAALLDTLEASSPPLDLLIIDEAHHMRNPTTKTNRVGRVMAELSSAVLLLTATPIHLGDENLYQLLRILLPEEFDNYEIFCDLLSANEPVIEAERLLAGGNPSDIEQCEQKLRQVEHGLRRERFINSPYYKDLCYKLANYKSFDRKSIIDMQSDMSHLNLLGHIVSRTKKRDVHERQPMRQAGIMRVQWTHAEKELYDLVTSYCRQRAKNALGNRSAASWFPIINLQRQMASSIPGMLNQYLKNVDKNDQGGLEDELSDFSIEEIEESIGHNNDEIPPLRQLI